MTQLLTVRQTAQMLRVAPITIRRYIADGKLEAVRVGRGVRVPEEAVAALLEPVQPKRQAKSEVRVPRGRQLTKEDSIWNIVGIAGDGNQDGPTDVSENKHRYLAEAYAATHE